MSRRRRRSKRRKGANTTDAFELFLDALCNALGVIMFILLCLVVFAKSPDGDEEQLDAEAMIAQIEQIQAEEVKIEAQLTAVLAALAALPPAGDPELVRRQQEVLAQLEQAREKRLIDLEAVKKQRARIAAVVESLVLLAEKVASLEAERAKLDAKRAAQFEVVQFVRISRWHADARDPVLLLCSNGRVSEAHPPEPGKAILEPGEEGVAVTDPATAQQAFDQFFKTKSPRDIRAEVVVWPSGFAAYKLLERIIIEKKFAINPLPVPAGGSIQEGIGGAQ